MAKKWLFWFCEGSVCVSGQNQMCRLCGCLKLFLKNAGRQKKIKKHWGGLSVGLLAVPFQYGLYVFGHLSKWFVFVLMFKFWSVYRLWNGRPTIGYNGWGFVQWPIGVPGSRAAKSRSWVYVLF